jgi:hypothetical protein
MVKYIYKGSLPITTQQTLLVNMLHISRKFQVTDCASACLSALMAIPQLQLDTVHLVLSLLPADAANSSAAAAATDSLDLQPLINYALDHLQQQLGDLEATFNSSQLLQGLQRLPHSALLGLLQDERTSAASENTGTVLQHHQLPRSLTHTSISCRSKKPCFSSQSSTLAQTTAVVCMHFMIELAIKIKASGKAMPHTGHVSSSLASFIMSASSPRLSQ